MKGNPSRSGKAGKIDKRYTEPAVMEKGDWQLRYRKRNKNKVEHLSRDLHKAICKYILTF